MNILAIINAIKLIFSLLPVIHQAVDEIEALFPAGGMGAQKLDMVKTILEKAMVAYGVGDSIFGNVWPIISGLIAQFVSIKKTSIPNAQNVVPVVEKSVMADTGKPLIVG